MAGEDPQTPAKSVDGDTPENTAAPEAPGQDAPAVAEVEGGAPGKTLTPAAKRALEEAAERRRKAKEEADKKRPPKEIDGRDGPEPTRYGDWEVKGTASDFS